MSDAPDLSPREAVERWLDKRSVELREQSLSSLRYRLKLFVEWCEENDFETLDELTGWNLDSYETERRSKTKPLTLSHELGTLRQFLEWAAGVGLMDESVAASVDPPKAPRDRSSDIRLSPDDALALIRHYRESSERATRAHALLELAWFTGARVGGLRSLDVHDFDADEEYVEFVHRPDSGTVLKNGHDGERFVALPSETVAVVSEYIDGHRMDIHDDHGRQPLLASQQGRPNAGTIRDWMYLATVPCHRGPCPHDKERATCEWYSYNYASKCPSSRSPHQVRTGAIGWFLNQGYPPAVVSDRVNSGVDVIEEHYDKERERRAMEERRREYVENLQLENEEA